MEARDIDLVHLSFDPVSVVLVGNDAFPVIAFSNCDPHSVATLEAHVGPFLLLTALFRCHRLGLALFICRIAFSGHFVLADLGNAFATRPDDFVKGVFCYFRIANHFNIQYGGSSGGFQSACIATMVPAWENMFVFF